MKKLFVISKIVVSLHCINVYVSTDPTQFSDSINDSYILVGKEINTEGYIKEIALNDSGDIFPESIGTSNKGDYHYVGTKTNTSLRTALLGGSSILGANTGVGYFNSNNGVSNTNRNIEFREFMIIIKVKILLLSLPLGKKK